jgi:hypothetical protein
MSPRNITALTVVFAIAAWNVCVAQSTDTARWELDQLNQCKIWNPRPMPNETVTWLGSCKNGFVEGYGTAEWYRDDKIISKTEGNFLSGRPGQTPRGDPVVMLVDTWVCS